jgi:hypothetical protein
MNWRQKINDAIETLLRHVLPQHYRWLVSSPPTESQRIAMRSLANIMLDGIMSTKQPKVDK